MSTTQVDALDTTVHKTNIWLKELMQELGTQDRHRAYLALRSVLQTLRDRLTVEEAAELGAQLPLMIRGIFYEAWNPTNQPIKYNHDTFLARVRASFVNEPDVDAEAIARAVFRVLAHRVAEGEIQDVKAILPAELRELWEA